MTDVRRPALPAGALGILVVALLAPVMADGASARAQSVETGACWTIRPVEGPRLRCRNARGDLGDHRSPETLGFERFPAEGWDIWGRCWYDGASPSAFDVRGDWFDEFGREVGAFAPGPGRTPVLGDWIRRCRAEPQASGDASRALSLASEFDLRPNLPTLSPVRGVAGLASVVSPAGVPPHSWVHGFPEFNEALLLRIEPTSIRVLWGDESVSAIGPEPRPSTHAYDRSGRYNLAVEIDWTGWWRVSWRPEWTEFSVGPFFVMLEYPVDEIVVRLVRS